MATPGLRVQVMHNRVGIFYVGHMFSNGVTILDAADPRKLKPVGFFTGGDFTRTHHLQVSDDLLLLANGANIVAHAVVFTGRHLSGLLRECAGRQYYESEKIPIRPQYSRYFPPGRDERDRLS